MSVAAFLETHTAIVGTTGAGKTVTGKGFVEQLLGDGRQVVVLDPTGAWWGLQSNAAGDGPGLRIVAGSAACARSCRQRAVSGA